MNIRYALPTLLLTLVFVTPAHAATPTLQVTDVVRSSFTVAGKKAPICKGYFTYTRPYTGESTTLLWRSKKATYMTGLYTDEKRPATGSQNIIFGHPGLQRFDLTFVGDGGKTTCTVLITVKERPVS